MVEAVHIASAHVRAEVRATAAIVRLAEFRVGNHWVAPFADAPWAGDPAAPAGHMRWLGGEFFCLPFGGEARAEAPDGWAGGTATDPLHGACANADWTIAEVAADRVRLTLDYAPGDAVERVERTIACAPDAAALDIAVTIHARRATRLPAAFHPILRLPEHAGALHLATRFADARTYPVTLGGGLAPDANFTRVNAVPGARGLVDLSRLPLGPAGEECVQLLDVSAPIAAAYPEEGFALTLDWDRAALPHALLWLHDRGLATPPWNGGFRGLGIEPCAAAFGLSQEVRAGDNPIVAAGHATTLALDPAAPERLWLRIAVEALA